MRIDQSALPDVLLITPTRHEDPRGLFAEVWRADMLAGLADPPQFVQDNLSRSMKSGTVRGLHFQKPPHAQGKLVRVVRGAILDVAVDIRNGSPTYGQHVAVELSDANWRQIWVPPGFLHGFLTLTDNTEVAYKVTEYYSAVHDAAVAWDDPDLGVNWPVPAGGPILSDKDRSAPRLAEIDAAFDYAPSSRNG